MAQSGLSVLQTSWPLFVFFIFFAAYSMINVVVAYVILLLTWPVRRNLDFSRYIKMLIAFSAVYLISQVIAVLVEYNQK